MLTNNPPDGITAGPVSEDDLLNWQALIQGPEGTPFEGGVFPAELKFPNDYPLSPPTMKFLGEIWHPNGTLQHLVFPPPHLCMFLRGGFKHTHTHTKKTQEELTLGAFIFYAQKSLSEWPGLHLHPTPRRRRPQPLRARLRAMVAHPVCREDPVVCHEPARRTQR